MMSARVDTAVRLSRTPDGRRIEVSRELPAPRDVVWDLLCDTESWPAWGPSVQAVDCQDRYITVGSTGRVELPLGLWVPFEVTECAGYRWTWTVARLPATGHRVDATADEDRCRAVFEVPPLAAGYVPVCETALERLEELALHKDGTKE
jgi:hypothetical protein